MRGNKKRVLVKKFLLIAGLSMSAGLTLALATEPLPLDGLRAALRADIAAQKGRKEDRNASARVAADEEALSIVDSLTADEEQDIERTIKRIAGETESDKARQECEALLRKLREGEAARVKQFAAEVEKTVHRASEAALKAQSARELDQPIAELRSILDHTPYGDETSARNAVLRRVERARDTAQHWQDYVAAREAGNIVAAKDQLKRLADEQQGGLDIPRSEILARIQALEPEEENYLKAEGRKILDSIHTLDDVGPALTKLHALPYARAHELTGVVYNLDTIARTYAGLQQGVAATLNLAHSRPGDSDVVVLRLHSQLLLEELPHVLQLPEERKAREGETVETYLRRIAQEAHQAQDWDLLSRVLNARKEITLHVAGTWSSDTLPEYAGFLTFQLARGQEKAQQYAAAVRLYQKALREGGTALPSEVIGQRLEAIKKEHPAEYEQGLTTSGRSDHKTEPARPAESPAG